MARTNSLTRIGLQCSHAFPVQPIHQYRFPFHPLRQNPFNRPRASPLAANPRAIALGAFSSNASSHRATSIPAAANRAPNSSTVKTESTSRKSRAFHRFAQNKTSRNIRFRWHFHRTVPPPVHATAPPLLPATLLGQARAQDHSRIPLRRPAIPQRPDGPIPPLSAKPTCAAYPPCPTPLASSRPPPTPHLGAFRSSLPPPHRWPLPSPAMEQSFLHPISRFPAFRPPPSTNPPVLERSTPRSHRHETHPSLASWPHTVQ